ncbi:hypothetical protein ID866_11676 [Astraeus odoratus]|nr:hypothetical protein ID866_11676 [Astraeus odoratus]
MTRVLDILEIFLNFHGYLYLRLDGATKIEDRQYITERFNADARVFCFISSSRSGGVGINLTGADTVIFYDSDFNPQMDRQCEDRAHRIGQIRDVHIYRFISSHTVEEAMLMKANQKRSLDEIVIQKGEFDWRTIFEDDGALTNALGEFEDTEDAHAAAVAAREEDVLEGANQADFGAEDVDIADAPETLRREEAEPLEQGELDDDHGDEDGGTTVDYMISFVRLDYEFFRDWRLKRANYDRPRLTVPDILHRTIVSGLAALSVYGLFLGYMVHKETLAKGREVCVGLHSWPREMRKQENGNESRQQRRQGNEP